MALPDERLNSKCLLMETNLHWRCQATRHYALAQWRSRHVQTRYLTWQQCEKRWKISRRCTQSRKSSVLVSWKTLETTTHRTLWQPWHLMLGTDSYCNPNTAGQLGHTTKLFPPFYAVTVTVIKETQVSIFGSAFTPLCGQHATLITNECVVVLKQ